MSDRLHNAPCGFVEFTDDGVISYANATLAGWIGLGPTELIGRKFESLLTVANRIFFQTHFFPLLTLHGHAEEIFLALRGRDGGMVPVVASARRQTGPDGARNHCAFVTVHERRRYEDEILEARRAAEDALRNNEDLRAAKCAVEERGHQLERTLRNAERRNQELERVTQILSHDLREPLRKIGLFADLVRSQVKATSDIEALEALRKIDVEARQMENLVNAMREFLEADAPAPLERVDLAQLVESAASTVALKLGFSDWVVDCEPLPEVEGRRAQLQLVFVHLLENAVKFREPSRRLRIKVRGRVVQQNMFEAMKDHYRYVDFAQIEVQDNGRGFDPKYKDYVFRLLKKVNLGSPGLGIGLALCRKIIGAHYGSMAVESKPGSGALFTLLLPVTQ